MDKRMFGFFVALLLLVVLTFSSIFEGKEFISDDRYLIRDNPTMGNPEGWRQILSQDLFGGASQPKQQVYRPLPQLSIWVQARLHGLSLSALRVGNLCLHVGCVFLFMYFLRRRLSTPFSPFLGFFVTVLLLVHPSVTELVMWVSARHDLMGTLFLLLGLCLQSSGSLRESAGLVLLTMLACFSKEAFVVSPIIFAINALRIRAECHDGARSRTGFLATSIIPFFGILPVVLVRHVVVGVSERVDQWHEPLLVHVRNYGTILGHYLVQLLSLRNGRTMHFFLPSSLGVWIFAAFTAVLLIFCSRSQCVSGSSARKEWRYAAFGLAWFMVVYIPHAFTLPHLMTYGNRYAYAAMFGLALSLLSFLRIITSFFQALEVYLFGISRDRRRLFAQVGGVAILAALSVITRAETQKWRSAHVLYVSDLREARYDPMVCYHVGVASFHLERYSRCSQAVRNMFRRATIGNPRYARAWYNLATCYAYDGDFLRAVDPARRALELDPDDPRKRFRYGEALLRAGRGPEAVPFLRRAATHHPPVPGAQAMYAWALREVR